ncbi:hypothetical protein Pyrde_1824 [Pyrodictium delaneyi]|uniref:Probable membrane transporter protein n=1 Tax=Pyrodictium delaneyi TaxID=1273541 RepID=A0A0P0N5S6_9CREN|nr:sulfite exporter TauE/SafE family protein [Pyrodictium delaneyi]ALL01867.1 hypothetical protein Pyrde_1824 [Pyrodictium delaneyi]OWJ54926.1 anion permease [Pyrodictium delaneyi]
MEAASQLGHHSGSLGGLVAGFSLGLTGGGGSALGVPLLVYIVGLSPHHAVGASLVAVGVISLISSVRYMRQGYVVYRIGLVMAAASLAGVYLGSYLNSYVEGPLLLVLFALLMIAIAARMLLRSNAEINNEAYTTAPSRASRIDYGRILLLGFITGVASGFFGAGGGFLIVPALVCGAGLEMREAIGTSLFIIFVNGVAGLVSYYAQGRPMDPFVTALFTLGGSIGGIFGSSLAAKVPGKTLRMAFSILLIFVAVYMIVTNIHAVLYQ